MTTWQGTLLYSGHGHSVQSNFANSNALQAGSAGTQSLGYQKTRHFCFKIFSKVDGQLVPCCAEDASASVVVSPINVYVQGGEELRKAARCPLCYSMVAARELKLVQVLPIHVPQV